jgi:hypothetical protein
MTRHSLLPIYFDLTPMTQRPLDATVVVAGATSGISIQCAPRGRPRPVVGQGGTTHTSRSGEADDERRFHAVDGA